MVDVLEDVPAPHVEYALKNFGKMLSVCVVEALDSNELRRLLVRAVALAGQASQGSG